MLLTAVFINMHRKHERICTVLLPPPLQLTQL